jgi:hypothetical protein
MVLEVQCIVFHALPARQARENTVIIRGDRLETNVSKSTVGKQRGNRNGGVSGETRGLRADPEPAGYDDEGKDG